jgi:apolipoprotein N-acyltransferase
MGSKQKKEKAPKRPPRDILIDLGLAILSGVLWFTACADIDIWPFAWVAMVPLLWVIHDKRPRKAFWYAMLAGFVANYGGYYWITGLLVRFAHLPWIVAFLICALLCLYQALVFGLFGAAVGAVRQRKPVGLTFLAPVIFVAAEMIVPMEFPFYVAITQAWVRPVIQIADLAGPVGISFVLVMFSGALFDALLAWREKRPWPVRRLAIAGGIVVFTVIYGFVQISRWEARIEKAPSIEIGVIQANLGIRVKGRAAFADAQLGLHHHLSQVLEKKGADLIVWPESTHPFPLSRDRRFFGKRFFSLLTRAGPQVLRRGHRTRESELDPATIVQTPLFVGVQTNEWGGEGDGKGKGRKGRGGRGRRRPEKIYNSAVLIDSGGIISGIYDKMELVAFSEKMPFYDLLTRSETLKEQFRKRRVSNFSAGDHPKALEFGRFKLGPMICFEDILPRFGRKMAAEKPNVFINITNDAWFGATAEPYQHLALAVFRTIEHRRPMVRAVNTGTSTYIDATGRITVQTPSVDPPPQPSDVQDPTPHVAAAGVKKVREGVWRSPAWPKPYILLESVAMMPHSVSVYAAVGWLFGWICLLVTLYLVFLYGRGLGRKLFRYRGEGMALPDRKGRLRPPEPEPEKKKPTAKGGGAKAGGKPGGAKGDRPGGAKGDKPGGRRGAKGGKGGGSAKAGGAKGSKPGGGAKGGGKPGAKPGGKKRGGRGKKK